MRRRNAVDGEIAEAVGRRALIGNVGELSTLSKEAQSILIALD